MSDMTPRIRIVTYITAGALVIATGVGCGMLGAAKKIAGNIGTISDFSDKLQKGLTLTYHAEYKDQDGTTVTVQQQPPNSVFVTNTGPFIVTADAIYSCDNSGGTMKCDKQTVTGTADATAALAASSLATGGFMAGEMGIVLLVAASVVPKAKIDKSSKTIAGQESDCVKVSDLSDTSDGNEDFVAFSMCITDAGVVSEFSGAESDGKTVGTTMTSFSTKVDPSLFQPPAGAVIIDDSNLPTAPPSDATQPSAEPSTEPSPSDSPSA